jgi:hypothetical protein
LNTKKPVKTLLIALLIVFLLVCSVVLGIISISPPTADEASPSFIRMMTNIEKLATGVRFVGTEEVAAARDEIIAEIEAMGLAPIVHRTVFTPEDIHEASAEIHLLHNESYWFPQLKPFDEKWENMWEEFNADIFPEHPLILQGYMNVDNILVTLKSPYNESGGMMFVTHYDSEQTTPGAADSMLSVAAMLEALRLYANHDNLANDIHFLFTSGEELFALGAWAFSEDFQYLTDEIDILLNFEAIGNSGGVINFQTSETSYDMIRFFSKTAPRPIGFHWGDWLYRVAITDSFTDFTVFREYGFQGMNFAILEGNEFYHTPDDNFENLNKNTAWHYLAIMMAMIDYAAENPLHHLQGPSADAIFFPFLPGFMVVMTTTAASILIGLAFATAIAFLICCFLTKIQKSRFIQVLLLLMLIMTAFTLMFASVFSYLFWIPMLLVSISAFTKKWKSLYLCTITLSGAITLLLWTPPVYMIFALSHIIF